MIEELNNILVNLKGTDPEIIEKALDDVGDLNPENALELILPFLNHHSKEVRETAVFNLAEIENEKGIPYIIEKVINDEDSVRMFDILALDNYRSKDILKILLKEVEQPKKTASPKQRVAEQLKNYPGIETQRALIYLIFNDENPYIYLYLLLILYIP